MLLVLPLLLFFLSSSGLLVRAQGTFGGPTDKLLVWYKFNDGSGTTAADSSGNGYTGIKETDGSFTTYSGIPVYDAYSSGVDTGVMLPTSFIKAFMYATNYTIMVHHGGQLTSDKLFWLQFGGDYVEFIPDYGLNKPRFTVHRDAIYEDVITSATSPPTTSTPNNWAHYAVTYHKNKVYKLYLDGALAGTLTTVTDPLRRFDTSLTPMAHVGCKAGSYNRLKGIFRDFRVYINRTLTQQEVFAAAYTSPTQSPSATPTQRPTTSPTRSPSRIPTLAPTLQPTPRPTNIPTLAPTPSHPITSPTTMPTQLPSPSPSASPTITASASPSRVPSRSPSAAPTTTPTPAPTGTAPTPAPSRVPSLPPSIPPTLAPSLAPTTSPSLFFTALPSRVPSRAPSKGPTTSPTARPTTSPTLLPTAPTSHPTLAPTQAPTSDRWAAFVLAGRKAKESCAYKLGPALGPLGLTLGLIILSLSGSCLKKAPTRKDTHEGSETDEHRPPSKLQLGSSVDAMATRKMNLAMNIKVFWGASSDINDARVAVPNPLKLGGSDVWSHDLSYHLCNHAWLPSMSFADPLDAYGGPWGHRAAFLLLAMLLFFGASVLALREHTLHTPGLIVLLLALAIAGLAPYVVHGFCRGLLLGFYQVDVRGCDWTRQCVASAGSTGIAVALWAVAFTTVSKHAQCGATRLLDRVWLLWLLMLIIALVIDLLALLSRYMPRNRSFKVKLCGMTVLRLNEWKKQLITQAFLNDTRIAHTELADKVKEWRETYHASPSFVNEAEAFKHATSFNRLNLWPLFQVIEYDVPPELCGAFAEAPAVVSSSHLAYDKVEPTFQTTQRVAELVQEEVQLIHQSQAAEAYTAILAPRRGGMLLTFGDEDEDEDAKRYRVGKHRNARAARYSEDMEPNGSGPGRPSLSSPRLASPTSLRNGQGQDKDDHGTMVGRQNIQAPVTDLDLSQLKLLRGTATKPPPGSGRRVNVDAASTGGAGKRRRSSSVSPTPSGGQAPGLTDRSLGGPRRHTSDRYDGEVEEASVSATSARLRGVGAGPEGGPLQVHRTGARTGGTNGREHKKKHCQAALGRAPCGSYRLRMRWAMIPRTEASLHSAPNAYILRHTAWPETCVRYTVQFIQLESLPPTKLHDRFCSFDISCAPASMVANMKTRKSLAVELQVDMYIIVLACCY